MRWVIPNWKFCVGGLLTAALVAVYSFCAWHNVWSYDEWLVYRCMKAECHPVWRDFLSGHVRAGDDVEEVIARTRPSIVKREGRTVKLEYYENYEPAARVLYFTGVYAEAEEGKLTSACASGCTWIRQFFDETGRLAQGFPEAYRELPNGGAIWVGGN